MSEVISVRVRKGTRKILEEKGIDVNEVVRSFLEELAWKVKIKNALENLDKLLEEMPPASKGFSAKSVREDRDSH